VNCLPEHEPIRTLRSSSKRLLTVNVADTVLATRGFLDILRWLSGTVCRPVFVTLPTLIFFNAMLNTFAFTSAA
jgi:hypothetical protein